MARRQSQQRRDLGCFVCWPTLSSNCSLTGISTRWVNREAGTMGTKSTQVFCAMIKAIFGRGKKKERLWPSYRLSWGSELLASCELCPLWHCSSRRRCSCPHRRAPPWRCRGCPSAGTRNGGCLAGQSTGTRWKSMHTWGLQDKTWGRMLFKMRIILSTAKYLSKCRLECWIRRKLTSRGSGRPAQQHHSLALAHRHSAPGVDFEMI